MHEEADTLSRVYSVSRFWGEGRTDGNQWRCMQRAAYGEGRWESRGLTTEGRREVDSPRQHWQSQMIHRTQPCSLCAKGPGRGLLNRPPAPNNNRFTSAVKSATQQTGSKAGEERHWESLTSKLSQMPLATFPRVLASRGATSMRSAHLRSSMWRTGSERRFHICQKKAMGAINPVTQSVCVRRG